MLDYLYESALVCSMCHVLAFKKDQDNQYVPTLPQTVINWKYIKKKNTHVSYPITQITNPHKQSNKTNQFHILKNI
jgi:hypothetical protein